jgi:hypothetical protein
MIEAVTRLSVISKRRITPEPVIGPRFARTRLGSNPSELQPVIIGWALSCAGLTDWRWRRRTIEMVNVAEQC